MSNAPQKLALDQRGVAYVEQLVLVCIGVLMAIGLVAAGNLWLAPRFQRIVDSVFSSCP